MPNCRHHSLRCWRFSRGCAQEIKLIAASLRRISFEITERRWPWYPVCHQRAQAVNIIQMAAGIAQGEGRTKLTEEDIEWVVNSGQLSPRPERKPPDEPQVGYVNGLAVYGPNMGTLIEVEATANPVKPGRGKVTITGIVEEEEMGGMGHTLRRKGTAKGAAENVITVLSRYMGINLRDYDIHLLPRRHPGRRAVCRNHGYGHYSPDRCLDPWWHDRGAVCARICPVPSAASRPRLEAAIDAGIKKIIIPHQNWQQSFKHNFAARVIPVNRIEEYSRSLFSQ